MSSRDEEQAVAALAAILAKFPAARRPALANSALQRLAAPLSTPRDAPTERVSGRIGKPSKRGE